MTSTPFRLLSAAFWFLRHGETSWNTQGLAQGRSEIALNERGLTQAAIAADALQGKGIVTIVASPMIRARVTAEVTAEKLGLPVRFDDGLVECAYGEKEGQPMHGWFDQWVDGSYTPDGGESFMQLRDRVAASFNRCLALDGPVLVVAHGAVMRALRAEMRLTTHMRTPNATPLYCAPPTGQSDSWTIDMMEIAEAPTSAQ